MITQRSLDDNKPQGPMVMTRTTTLHTTAARNEATENTRLTAVTTTARNNILVTKFENIFNKFLKCKNNNCRN